MVYVPLAAVTVGEPTGMPSRSLALTHSFATAAPVLVRPVTLPVMLPVGATPAPARGAAISGTVRTSSSASSARTGRPARAGVRVGTKGSPVRWRGAPAGPGGGD